MGDLFPPDHVSSKSSLDHLGATMVARCKPTNSVANTVAALKELHSDGLPSIPGLNALKDKSLFLKTLGGGEFLNVVFGWKPLIADLKSFRKAVEGFDRILRQYHRDAGGVVRRSYGFPKTTTVEVHSAADYDPQLWFMTPHWATPSTMGNFVQDVWSKATLTRTIEQRQWFKGAFTYYVPVGNDLLDKLGRYASDSKKIGGLLPTPDELWQAQPWSWAVDWFSNAGDVISNLTDSATDSLVMRYGYVMEHTIVTDTYSCDPIHLQDDSWYTIPPISFITETKLRQKANPFGFGLTWDGLSPVQLAIAAAIGITRGR